ncbi:DoxX family membrane protein [Subsaxibacter sp. CAU 1640]|uniref:BT_3928 family protein n=1 Tax=Subsaxibacter sp. CAU 1640 TaxID=2933271 RepID=UPI002006D663|nr:BT_3928 family protein [Subsaxibacter sp. CAU 1640]MCK7591370.1 DoxX family membrane protein [Subsaxibacter sp. CAU 1640]
MKYIVNIARILVGVLFIISGWIKLNDPLGFSYKLQEYFGTDVLNLPFLEPYALGISIFVVVFEVVLGVFLLIGYKPKFTIWSLLAMIVFFTFLTFYSAYFDKVKDCGCFGDALKLTPWESFTKDVILLVLILIIFFGIKHIKPIFSKFGVTLVALLSFVLSLWFGYHVLMHLPTVDFRAYKIGNNIQEQMSTPADAPKPLIEYYYTFNVNGKEETYTVTSGYPEVDGELVKVDSKIIDEGYVPPIQDFSIESDDENLTDYFLEEPKLVMVVMYDLSKAEWEGVEKLKAMSEQAMKKGYKVIGLTSSGSEAKANFKAAHQLDFDFYLCDEKVLKTIVRANPGVVVLNKGTVKQKVHWNDIDDLKF